MNRWIFSLALTVFLALTAGSSGLSHPGGSPGEDGDPQAESVPLPKPDMKGMTTEEAIGARRSIRRYSAEPLTLRELSQLLFSAQGITGHRGSFPLRAAPSAGALYPIELYVVVNNVRHLQQGLYHYSSQRHALDLVKADDYRARISRCCLHQDFVGQAAVALVMTAIFHRTTDRYGQRGNRYVYMEAGHISQNIYLQTTSLGLGSVAVGAFNDEKLNTLLGVDGQEEMAIYVHAVGKRAAELE